ncbi:MAG TPA: cupin domain-containing protein [Sphingomicrobium sp.]|nr:cupin domain-containing protein [Sphingomicrobium sp.]
MSTIVEHALPRGLALGFVDVLGSKAEWPASDRGQTVSYLSGRRRLPLPKSPVTVESVILPAGANGQAELPGDEFVLVLSGQVRFNQKERELRVGEGEAAVVLRNHTLDWTAEEQSELLVMRCIAGGSAAEPVVIDTKAPLSASNPPLAHLLVGPTPNCRNHSDFRSETGEFVCGTWDSTPYHRRLMEFGHFELMRLLEGQVTFVDQHGRTGTFSAGDVVLFVRGGGCSWESRSHVKKIYATYRPAQTG